MKAASVFCAFSIFVGTAPLFSGALNAKDAKQEPQTEAQRLYEAHCASCHQYDGGGVPMLQPELIGRPRANGAKGGVIDMILFGSATIAPTESDYSNEMPAFSHLTDLEIALIASYVRTHFENEGGPVTSNDVRARRTK